MHPAMQRRRRHLMMRRTTRRGSQRRRGLATFMLITLGVFGMMFAGSVLGTAGGMLAAYNYFATGLPDPRVLDNIELPQSTEIYDRTGKVLLTRFECQNREAVDFAQIPKVIVDATVASEDRTFWTNSGIDIQGIGRAVLANFKAKRIVQGASTITQQVIDYAGALREVGQSTVVKGSGSPAPSVSINPDQALEEQPPLPAQETEVCQPPVPSGSTGFEQKIREQILATQVTSAYPGRSGKERILDTYLNLIYYGNGSYGIKAAAANYFGLTDLEKMTPAQAAFLAALPQAPSFLDPYQNPNGAADAIRERNLVLGRMRDEHYITPAQYRGAIATTWEQMNPSRVTSILREPQFSFRVRGEAERILSSLPGITDPKLAVRTGGYKITTTIDLKLQEVAREEVKTWVANLADKNVNNGALVAINSKTGEIVAYVGSVDYNNRKDPKVQGQFDVAGLGVRQPGSAFKPITYTSAFKAHKATVSTMLVDALTEFGQDGTTYRPTDADIRERGPVLATDALRYSMNIPSVQMQFLVGPKTTAKFAESLGIASSDYIMSQDPGLTLTLGSVPVNLTNMTQAYGVFAAQGELHPATTILEIRDRNNRLVYSLPKNGPEVTKPLTPSEAYLTHWILEGNTDPARNLLWGTRALLTDPNGVRRHAGFKTGTTDDFRDVSGFGYIPGSLVTGVWMGNNNQEPMSNVLGVGLFSADGPLYMWHDFMQRAINEPWDWNKQKPVPQTDFAQPADIKMVSVCRFSGMAASGSCGQTQVMPFLPGTVPAIDNVHPRGCLDLVQYVRQSDPTRPDTWAQAAQIWSDRVVNGEYGSRGDPKDYLSNASVRFAITPILGQSLPAVCGNRRYVPPPPKKPGKGSPAPQPTPAPTKHPGRP